MKLVDKVAMVTGSARGIGRDISRRFSQEGAHVIVADIDGEGARRVAAEIESNGAKAIPLELDVGDPGSVDAMFAAVLQRCGRIDVRVNNAGIGSNQPVLAMALAEWNENLRINLTGTFLCA